MGYSECKINTVEGVLLVWDKKVYKKINSFIGQFSINVLLKEVVDDFVWACSGVSIPNDDS